MKRIGKFTAAALLLAVFAVFAAGCSQDVNPGSDQLACIYDGSKHGGNRFLKEVQPGEHLSTDSGNHVAYLPTSNRFYNMTDSENRDTLAPPTLSGVAADNTNVIVQGVLRFRFNTEGNKACEWYSKHGRRNANASGDLGFNVRGTAEQAHAGWFRFLAENFGDTMKQVVHDGSHGWTWQQLVYGNDPTISYKGANPVDVQYGIDLGALFTKYLDENLGGHYFCGIQPSLTGVGSDPNCPPIYFQVLNVQPKDPTLTQEHEKLQRLQASLAAQKQEATLNAENRASLIADAKAQREVLNAQIENARLQALTASTIQHCLILAKVGLDCDGHWAPVVVSNGTKVTGR